MLRPRSARLSLRLLLRRDEGPLPARHAASHGRRRFGTARLGRHGSSRCSAPPLRPSLRENPSKHETAPGGEACSDDPKTLLLFLVSKKVGRHGGHLPKGCPPPELLLPPPGQGGSPSVGALPRPCFRGRQPARNHVPVLLLLLLASDATTTPPPVIYNRETDHSRGFGFVTMSTIEEAEKAVEMFHCYLWQRAGTAGKVTPVPMTLRTTVRSRAYVLGALVKPRFTKNMECKVVMDPAKLNKPISLEKACQYS